MAKIACYCRVSTQDQNLERQIEKITEYAQNKLDADLNEIEVYRDKSTGTNTNREKYLEMMEKVENGEIQTIVTKAVSRLSRSIRDLDKTVERVVEENDTALHIIDENFVFEPGENDPYQKAMFRMLGTFAELEAELSQERVREGIKMRQKNEDYHHGRPPLGFEKEDGRLIEKDDYDRIVTVLDMVKKGELSKRKAASELDTSRKSINRALDDRSELYGL